MSRPLGIDDPDGLDGALLVSRRGTRRWRAVLAAVPARPDSPVYRLHPAGRDVGLGGGVRVLVRTFAELYERGWRRVA